MLRQSRLLGLIGKEWAPLVLNVEEAIEDSPVHLLPASGAVGRGSFAAIPPDVSSTILPVLTLAEDPRVMPDPAVRLMSALFATRLLPAAILIAPPYRWSWSAMMSSFIGAPVEVMSPLILTSRWALSWRFADTVGAALRSVLTLIEP